jgi:hypothetical protein
MIMGKWLVRLVGAAVITVALAALCQELEKPREERRWHGKLGFIPYDFRLPTIERLREAYWNVEDSRIFTKQVWGIGWAINFYALLEKMRIVGEIYVTEDDFLMPTPTLRKILENRPVISEPAAQF